jgi:LysR family transcriptional regulator, glycine cleavage system transcriptional activator
LEALAFAATNEKIAVDACRERMYGVAMTNRNAMARPAAKRRHRPIQLAALRGFEAAARHLSFTLAADELALTQSSISRQIATLERQLGKSLFARRTRALALTPAGVRLQTAVTQALAGIDRCADDIRGVGQPPRVSLSTYASFASLWLVPRLAAFQRAHPQIEIRIDASDRLVDLDADGIDVAIRHCKPAQLAGVAGATLLCEEFLTPALSPHLLERSGKALNQATDLSLLPLIDMDDQWASAGSSSWARWFEFAGVSPRATVAGRLTFSFIDQAVQAAVRGQGVVLGRSPLLDDAVANGQLATPFPRIRMPTGYNHYLLVHPGRAASREVSAFAQWLVEESARGPQRFS